ncbi:MAG: hypothetical protein WEB67_04600 [Acidimicrobiia bacterium]
MALESPGTEERIGVASGRLRWTRVGDDLVSGKYRIHFLGPGQWETTHRGRFLRVDTRCSMALAMAEHHHGEIQRIQQITRWGLSAGAALLAAFVLTHWISTPLGLFLFAAAVWVFLGSVARCGAAITRSLLDPYRTRESWEPPDWWNPHLPQ